MNRIIQAIKEERNRTIFYSVLLTGICIHGSRIFTAYYSHDDVTMRGVGTTYTSGRWFLQVLFKIQTAMLDSAINTKGFLGIMVLALFTLICCILAYGLDLRTKQACILLSCVIVTFPYTASLLSYTYTAPHYLIAAAMSVLAAVLVRGGGTLFCRICRSIGGIVLIGLSMAVYQTSVCVFIAFLALMAFQDSLESEAETWKDFLFKCVRYLSCCAAGCFFYYLSNKAVLAIKGFSMSGYSGLDHMSEFTPRQLLDRVILAYREFFSPATDQNYSFYITRPIRLGYFLALFCFLAFSLSSVLKEVRTKKYGKAVRLSLVAAILPLAVNSMFLSADAASVNIYSLMLFSQVMLYVHLAYALERWMPAPPIGKKFTAGLRRAAYGLISLVLIYVSVYFAYASNDCYTKAAVQQSQTVSYFNRLIARMQSAPGYTPDLPVIYVNEWNKHPEDLWTGFVNGNDYRIAAYQYENIINLYNWEAYMQLWCGYKAPSAPQEVRETYPDMPQVRAMPPYPAQGSIQVINDVLVVKFAEQPYP